MRTPSEGDEPRAEGERRSGGSLCDREGAGPPGLGRGLEEGAGPEPAGWGGPGGGAGPASGGDGSGALSRLLRRWRKMAAAEAADTQLMLGVGLIGEDAGALPRRPVPQFRLSLRPAGAAPAPAAPGAARVGRARPLRVGPGRGVAGPGLLGAGARPAALGSSARGLAWARLGRAAGRRDPRASQVRGGSSSRTPRAADEPGRGG